MSCGSELLLTQSLCDRRRGQDEGRQLDLHENAASASYYQSLDAFTVTGPTPAALPPAGSTWQCNTAGLTLLPSLAPWPATHDHWNGCPPSSPNNTDLPPAYTHVYSGTAGDTINFSFSGSLVECFLRPDTGDGYMNIIIDGATVAKSMSKARTMAITAAKLGPAKSHPMGHLLHVQLRALRALALAVLAGPALAVTAPTQTITSNPSGGGGTQYYFNASTGTDNGNCTSSSSPCRTISQANALTYPNGATINLAGGTTFSGTTLTLTTSNVQGALTVNGNWGGGSCNVLAGQTSGCAVIATSGSQACGIIAHDLSNLIIENLRIVGSANTSVTIPSNCTYAGCPSGVSYDITRSLPGGTVGNSNITIQNVETVDFSFGLDVNEATNANRSYYNPPTSNGNPSLQVLANNVTIKNNWLHGSTLTTPAEYGILVNSLENSLIQGNLITYIGGQSLNGTGILVQSSLNLTDQYNAVHDNAANIPQNAANWAYGGQNNIFQYNDPTIRRSAVMMVKVLISTAE